MDNQNGIWNRITSGLSVIGFTPLGLVLVVLLMVVLGTDRIFFLTSAAKEGALAWIDWYIFEYLAHIVWAVIIVVLAVFFLRVGRKGQPGDEGD